MVRGPLACNVDVRAWTWSLEWFLDWDWTNNLRNFYIRCLTWSNWSRLCLTFIVNALDFSSNSIIGESFEVIWIVSLKQWCWLISISRMTMSFRDTILHNKLLLIIIVIYIPKGQYVIFVQSCFPVYIYGSLFRMTTVDCQPERTMYMYPTFAFWRAYTLSITSIFLRSPCFTNATAAHSFRPRAINLFKTTSSILKI